ncbi:MAG: class IV adenylate cyclase [Candidatus Falkowbacteria bacterium]|nr:class IV adenylate cyclase [Candidatus Falkowbacteria bacterium]
MRQEIEVKAKVNDLEILKQKLVALGCVLSEPLIQNDITFVNHDESYDKLLPGENILRIRKSNDKILFTVKQSLSNELACFEREVEINSAEEMKEAILLMGYHEVVRINKQRIRTDYNGYEICLDEVENLGSFIEIEKLTEGEDESLVQAELNKLLLVWGVNESDFVTHGYDTLIYLAQNSNN